MNIKLKHLIRNYLLFFTSLLLAFCNDKSINNHNENEHSNSIETNKNSVKFLNKAGINNEYCKSITNEEKAALAYIATFIGSSCNWDGEYKEDRSNLKCEILTALNLGYQCSEKHLGFLRYMFRNDSKVLQELKMENCPTTPETSTIQTTFDEITISRNNNEITVFFRANGINLNEQKKWSWSETDIFKTSNESVVLLLKEKSKEVVKELKFEK